MIERYETVGAIPCGCPLDENDVISQRVPIKGTPTYKYNRQSLRLKHYNYSGEGYYFITIVVQNREHLFGEIVDGVMGLNVAGEIVEELWHDISHDFKYVKLHEFIIMPNHIHGIIEIKNPYNTDIKPVGVPLVGTLKIDTHNNIEIQRAPIGFKRAPTRDAPTVGDMIGTFKSKTTNQYIKMVKNNTLPPFNKRIWQRNYYEHIIRDENDYTRIAEYIVNNPLSWELDRLNP